jgi:hypothetical protein
MFQLWALWVKRFHSTKRDSRTWLCQFLVPILLLSVGLVFLRVPVYTSSFDLKLATTVYPDPATPVAYSSVLPDPFKNNSYIPLSGPAAALTSLSQWSSSFANVRALDLGLTSNAVPSISQQLSRLPTAGAARYGCLVFGQNALAQITLAAVWSNGSATHGIITFLNLGHNVLLQAAYVNAPDPRINPCSCFRSI